MLLSSLLVKTPGAMCWIAKNVFAFARAMTTLQVLFLLPTVGLLLWLPMLFKPHDPPPSRVVDQSAAASQLSAYWNAFASGASTDE
jgi:hypothetical protein